MTSPSPPSGRGAGVLPLQRHSRAAQGIPSLPHGVAESIAAGEVVLSPLTVVCFSFTLNALASDERSLTEIKV